MKTLLFAVAAAGVLTLAGSAYAGDAVLSPKAQSLADSLKKVPAMASTGDVNLATNRPIGNAKAWSAEQSLKKVPSTGPSMDLAHAPRPALSPKDSRYEAALRDNAAKQLEIQVAPLK